MKTTIKAFLRTILLAVVSFAGCKIFDMIAGTGTTLQQYTLCLVLLSLFEINAMKRNKNEDQD